MKSIITAVLAIILFSCNSNSVNNSSADSTTSSNAVMYYNGDIITMEGDSATYAEAIVIKDGKIDFVGSKDEAMKAAGDNHTMNDLQGKTLLPGFIDGHSHFINSLELSTQANVSAPPVGPGKDVTAIIATIKDFATKKNIAKGEIITGWGYDDTKMPNGESLNRDNLDAAFPDNPVVIIHTTMHGCVLNSAAMKKFNITKGMKVPEGGVIQFKPGTDEPYGLLMETAYLPVFSAMPKPTQEQMIEFLKDGQMMYAEAGVTTEQEGGTHLSDIKLIAEGAKQNKLFIDVVPYPIITDLKEIIKEFPYITWGKYSNHFKVGGCKVVSDGSPQAKTAFFTTPYLTGGPAGQKNWVGEPTFPQDMLNGFVKELYKNKVQMIIHGNGDASMDMILKAHEYACKELNQPLDADRRTVVIHSQFVRRDQLGKYKAYNITPSFYTEHTFFMSPAHIKNRGMQQASFISPVNSAMKLGLKPTNHTDFAVLPMDQMMTVWTAVNRPTPDGKVLGPDERITPYQALQCITINGARQYFEENNKGSLKAGKLADLVILDKNPLKVEAMTIKDIKVMETIKEGKTVYKK